MKVRMDQREYCGWYECDCGEPIELPDAIIVEWRSLKARLGEIEKYFDERIPPLQREADAKAPAPPFTPIEEQLSNRWAKLLLDYYLDHSYGCLNPKKDAAD